MLSFFRLTVYQLVPDNILANCQANITAEFIFLRKSNVNYTVPRRSTTDVIIVNQAWNVNISFCVVLQAETQHFVDAVQAHRIPTHSIGNFYSPNTMVGNNKRERKRKKETKTICTSTITLIFDQWTLFSAQREPIISVRCDCLV